MKYSQDITVLSKGSKLPQFLAASAVTLAAFATGLHTGWPTPSLPKLLSEEYPFEVSNDEASYITIIGPLGNLIGGLCGTIILDKIGRRRTLLLIALPQIVSFTMIALSYFLMELLYVARFVGGLSEGMVFTIVPIYLAEIAEPTIRGTLGTMMALACITGMLFVNMVGSYLTIKVSAIIFLAFPILFLLLFWKMPDSPYYLLMKNRHEEAEKALQFLRRKKDVSGELSVLTKDVNRQMSESGTFCDIFAIDSNRKALFLAFSTRTVQQLTGFSAFSLYSQLLLKEATQSLAPHLGASLLLLVQLCMAFLSTLFVDKFGRKPLLLVSAIGCFINLAVQAVYFTLKEYTSVDVLVVDWFPLVMMVGFVILFSVGLGVVPTLMMGEMFSASIKSKTVCLTNVAFSLGMLFTTKFYQITADTYGLSVPYWSFAFCTFLGVLFICCFVPETKGKSLEEIQQQLKGNKDVIKT